MDELREKIVFNVSNGQQTSRKQFVTSVSFFIDDASFNRANGCDVVHVLDGVPVDAHGHAHDDVRVHVLLDGADICVLPADDCVLAHVLRCILDCSNAPLPYLRTGEESDFDDALLPTADVSCQIDRDFHKVAAGPLGSYVLNARTPLDTDRMQEVPVADNHLDRDYTVAALEKEFHHSTVLADTHENQSYFVVTADLHIVPED